MRKSLLTNRENTIRGSGIEESDLLFVFFFFTAFYLSLLLLLSLFLSLRLFSLSRTQQRKTFFSFFSSASLLSSERELFSFFFLLPNFGLDPSQAQHQQSPPPAHGERHTGLQVITWYPCRQAGDKAQACPLELSSSTCLTGSYLCGSSSASSVDSLLHLSTSEISHQCA
jgi:hypothetical protein